LRSSAEHELAERDHEGLELAVPKVFIGVLHRSLSGPYHGAAARGMALPCTAATRRDFHPMPVGDGAVRSAGEALGLQQRRPGEP